MKVKEVLFLMVLMTAGSAWAINDQSIKGENTFGLIEDRFDLFFYPEYLADFEGYEVYTNLHNTSGANRFQIGWFGLPKKVPGKLFFMFDTTREKTSEEVYLPPLWFTPNWPNFLNPWADFEDTGRFGFFNLVDTQYLDDDGDGDTDRRVERNLTGESWNESSRYEFLLAYGVPIGKKFSLGAGFVMSLLSGERRDSRSTFDISYTEIDSRTGTVLESYSDRADGRIETGASSLGFIVGAKVEPVDEMKIGVDFYYTSIDSDGSGRYTSYSRDGDWRRGSDRATLRETISGPTADPAYDGDPVIENALPYDGNNLGIRLKTYFPLGDKNTLRFDAVFEFTSLDVKSGTNERTGRRVVIDTVNNERTDSLFTQRTAYSGEAGKGTGISLLLADAVRLTDAVELGFGIGYDVVKRKWDLRRSESLRVVTRIDTNNDGDAIDAPLDDDPISGLYDVRETQEGEIEQDYRFEVTTHYLKIPVALEVFIIKRLALRLGVSHFIIADRNDETLSLRSGSRQLKETIEEGNRGRNVTYTPFRVPENRKSSRVETMSITDYRIGLGFEASKNISVELLGNYQQNWDDDTHLHHLSIEPHEGSSVWTIFGSATIRF